MGLYPEIYIESSHLLFCETYLVFYILNFEKVSKKNIYLLYFSLPTNKQINSIIVIISLGLRNKLARKYTTPTYV